MRVKALILWSIAFVVGLGLLLPSVAMSAGLPELVGARVTGTDERARLILDLSATARYAIVALSNPDRIAVDVEVASVSLADPEPGPETGLVTSFETGMLDDSRARTQLTLRQPAQVQQAYVLDASGDEPARLVVDLIPDSAENFALRVADDLAASLSGKSAIETAALPTDQPANTEPKVQRARPLIVLDPGHGGIDSGAETATGLKEKDIVLAFALKLQSLLVATGAFDVALTRNSDEFITLEDRVTLARQNKADLLISIHADTFSEPAIRGASIYTRDERATDVLDKILADQENRADLVAGLVPPDTEDPVIDLLVDMMRRDVRHRAFEAAEDIVKVMQPSVALRRFPIRQADFYVLQAPDVPSILLELGFLSNNDDMENLISEEWIDQVAEAIATGVKTHFDAGTEK